MNLNDVYDNIFNVRDDEIIKRVFKEKYFLSRQGGGRRNNSVITTDDNAVLTKNSRFKNRNLLFSSALVVEGDDYMGFLLVVLIIVGLLVFWVIAIYNGLIRSKNIVDNAWAQIEAQLQRRYDLIPNLVNTVKGYAAHEKGLFEGIAEAKERMVNAGSIAEKGEASQQVSNSLKSIFALSEAYPELKANENFLRLQEDLKGTEDKVTFSRQFYNDSVTRYNTKLELFPSNIFANMFGMTTREYFALENNVARENVKVEF